MSTAKAAPPVAAAVPAPDAPLAPAFALGPIDSQSEVACEMARVARALADGTLAPPRARLLLEVLRETHDKLRAHSGHDYGAEIGRAPNDAEIEFMIAHDGRPPPGVTVVRSGLRVAGPPYVPPEEPAGGAAQEDADEVDPEWAKTAAGRFIFGGRALH